LLIAIRVTVPSNAIFLVFVSYAIEGLNILQLRDQWLPISALEFLCDLATIAEFLLDALYFVCFVFFKETSDVYPLLNHR